MIVKFDDGLKLEVDDEKLISWQQSDDKKFIYLIFQGGKWYKIDLEKKEIKRM